MAAALQQPALIVSRSQFDQGPAERLDGRKLGTSSTFALSLPAKRSALPLPSDAWDHRGQGRKAKPANIPSGVVQHPGVAAVVTQAPVATTQAGCAGRAALAVPEGDAVIGAVTALSVIERLHTSRAT